MNEVGTCSRGFNGGKVDRRQRTPEGDPYFVRGGTDQWVTWGKYVGKDTGDPRSHDLNSRW